MRLTSLNLKSGNNTVLDSLFTTNNPELTCVEGSNLNYLVANFNSLSGSLDPQL